MRMVAVALLALSTVVAQDQISDEALEKAKQLTVMINAAIDGDTRPGAGVTFALANDRVYIATANHLVRRGTSKANDIKVEFRWLPGEQFAAELLTYYDTALDLAVVVVPGIAKTGADRAALPFDRLGSPTSLTQGVRGAALWAIGYPDGTAYDISTAQVSQVEALLIKYRVPGLVPGGYSGGPVVDSNGLIVGMIRQDQPPNGEATRMNLVIDQLRAWNYPTALQEPGSNSPRIASNPAPVEFGPPAGTPSTTAATETKAPAGVDPFRDTLLRYIAEAPTEFMNLGAKKDGNWVPTVTFPNAVSCKGGGPNGSPFIECILFIFKDRSSADLKFAEILERTTALLPGWKRSDVSQYGEKRQVLSNGSVSVDIATVETGPNINVYLNVLHLK